MRARIGAWLLLLSCTLGPAHAAAQVDPDALERELRGEEVPEGATIPAGESSGPASPKPGARRDGDAPAESPEPPPPDAPPLVEPEALREDELTLDDAAQLEAGVTLGFVVGWGFALDNAPNAWAFGIGVQGGYTLPNRLHLGARFIYDLGQGSQNLFDFGLEGGYALRGGVLRVIPLLGVGIGFLTVGSASSPQAYLAPGLLAHFMFDGFYAGLELRWQVLFDDPARMGILPMAAIGLSY